jgi:hypothetical protein
MLVIAHLPRVALPGLFPFATTVWHATIPAAIGQNRSRAPGGTVAAILHPTHAPEHLSAWGR